jgi:hypothetical protein
MISTLIKMQQDKLLDKMPEVQLRMLRYAAYALAMDCLQSERYQTDAGYRQAVDDVLTITGVPA